MAANLKRDGCEPVPKLLGLLSKICDIFCAALTEATGCSDVISCARRYGGTKKIVLVPGFGCINERVSLGKEFESAVDKICAKTQAV